MIEKAALDAIIELARRDNSLIEVNDSTYARDSKGALQRVAPWTPEALELPSLTALVAYITQNPDGLPLVTSKLLVCGGNAVQFYRWWDVDEVEARPLVYVRDVNAQLFERLSLSDVSQIGLSIALQTYFVDTPERAELLKLIGCIDLTQAAQLEDDGVTQTVSTRAGVVMAKESKVKNPWKLKPRRTFVEVEQPESHFVLRVSKDGKFWLIEHAGQGWEAAAQKTVGEWLAGKLEPLSEKPLLLY